MKLMPKNWSDFQHYKDRAPPWIKLHKGLLDDSAFQRLPTASRALAPMLWLLASEQKDGSFDADHVELAFRLRQTEKEIKDALTPLISKGFFLLVQDASSQIAQCNPDAMPETEKRQRTERETEKSASAQSAYADLVIDVDQQVINDWKKLRAAKKSPITRLVIEGLIREAGLAGYTLEQAMREGVERGWTSFKAAWVVDKGGGYAQATANKQQALEDRADETLKQYLATKELNNVVN